jgi:hypothetical protein
MFAAALLVLAAAGCSSTPSAAQAASPPSIQAPAGGHASIPHGDHTPRYGGTVYMNGDLHFEVVFDSGGRHRVFFSDATRAELPAAIASDVTLTLPGRTTPPEQLRARIDDSGESWIVEGPPPKGADAMARVSFVVHGEPYWIDVPFVPTTAR